MWLTTEQWQAIGTVVLVLVAGVALFLNGRSGHHAREAANAAKLAAEAARETAAAQMASITVDFRIDLTFSESALGKDLIPPITLTCQGANVYVHELILDRIHGGRRIKTRHDPCQPAEGRELPSMLHDGGSFRFDWPGELPDRSKMGRVWFDLTYGFGGAGATTFVRPIGASDVRWLEP